jgi:hypothetical protein
MDLVRYRIQTGLSRCGIMCACWLSLILVASPTISGVPDHVDDGSRLVQQKWQSMESRDSNPMSYGIGNRDCDLGTIHCTSHLGDAHVPYIPRHSMQRML